MGAATGRTRLIMLAAAVAAIFALVVAGYALFARGAVEDGRPGPVPVAHAPESVNAPVSDPASPAEPRQLAPAAGAPPATIDEPPLPDTVGVAVTFRGRVVDPEGAPLAAARIQLVPSGPTLRAMGLSPSPWSRGDFGGRTQGDLDAVPLARVPSTIAGEDGRFALVARDVPLRDRDPDSSDGAPVPVLIVMKSGWASVTRRTRSWLGAECDVGDIALEPELVVRGRAVEEQGRPLAGVAVRCSNFPEPAHVEPVPNRLFVPELCARTTGPDGRFELTGLWPGRVYLELTVPGRVPAKPSSHASSGMLDLGDVVLGQGGAIEGIVVDSHGQPIAGAALLAWPREILGPPMGDLVMTYPAGADTILDEIEQVWPRDHEPARSGADGSFRIAGLDGVRFSVYALADGQEPLRVRDVPAGGSPLRLEMQAEAVWVADVVDAAGALLPDATMDAARLPGGDGHGFAMPAALSVISGAAAAAARPGEEFPPGRFLVRGAGPNGTLLRAVAPGKALVTREMEGLAPGARGIARLRLPPEHVVNGHVRDEAGAPVPGAVVLVGAPGAKRGSGMQLVADPEGGFSLRQLGVLELGLRARAEGFAECEPVTVAVGEESWSQEVDLKLPREARIRGTLRDGAGRPLSDTEVTIDVPPFGEFKWEQLSDDWVSDVRTTADGSFEFTRLGPGSYRLSVREAVPVDVTLAAGEQRTIDLALQPHAHASGRVTAAGRPAKAVSITPQIVAETGGTQSYAINATVTNEQGLYDLELAGAGTYELKAGPAGGPSVKRTVVVEAGGSVVVDFEVAGGSIAGTVRDDATDRPVKGEVCLLQPDGLQVSYTQVDEVGAFAFRCLPAGDYLVRHEGGSQDAVCAVVCPARPVTEVPVALAEGAAVEGLALRPCTGAILAVRVRAADGLPAGRGFGAWVVRLAQDQPAPFESFYSASEDGRWRHVRRTEDSIWIYAKDGAGKAEHLPPGDYRVLAGNGSTPAVADIVARGVAVTLRVHETATVEVTLPP